MTREADYLGVLFLSSSISFLIHILQLIYAFIESKHCFLDQQSHLGKRVSGQSFGFCLIGSFAKQRSERQIYTFLGELFIVLAKCLKVTEKLP